MRLSPPAIMVLSLAGCSNAPQRSLLDDASSYPRPASATSVDNPETSVLALVNGRPITLGMMRPLLLEAAGSIVAEEIALDFMLEAEARRLGVDVSAEDIARERDLFLDAVTDAGLAPAGTARDQLLFDIRRARGLGPERFDRMLRRSALLRAIVRDEDAVTEEMIALAHRISHGERRRPRLITTATLADAQAALDAIREGMDFAEAAARFSTDPSAVRGGLVEPISPADPSYPDALRATLARMTVGEVRGPIALDAGYAIARLEEIIPPTGVSPDESRNSLARALRLQEERRRMADYAERLFERAEIRMLDPRIRIR